MKTAVADKTDLSGLPDGGAGKLNRLSVYIAKEKGNVVSSILKIGEYLTEVKSILGTGGRSSEFGPWVEKECHFVIRTADRYIDAYSVFGQKKSDSLSNFSAESMYLLSSDSTPEDAASEAIKRADKGESIDLKVAKEIIAKHNGDAPRKPAKTPEKTASTETLDAPEPKPLTTEEKMKAEASELESWCRQVAAMLVALPESKWLDKNRRDTIKAQLGTPAATVRAAKGVGVCPACKGKSCKKCRETGWMPKIEFDSNGGKS